MAYGDKTYAGAAIASALTGNLGASDLSFSVSDATGWPSANFVVTLSRGGASEEKVLCVSRTGLVVNVVPGGRGYDGTTATTHASGDSAIHTYDSVSAQEANKAVVETIGRITAKGDLLSGSGPNAFTKLPIGTSGQVAKADPAAAGGISWGTVAQAVTHDSPDTDAASGSLHHTVGTGANQAAAGTHSHAAGTGYTQTIPAGVINQFAGAAAPTGWLLCDGTAVSRTTYAGLFAVISTTYGVGDGSTTFNVPNLKGRVPVGVDTGQAEFDVLGEIGGAKTTTLVEANLPPHAHSIAHDHGTVTSTTQPITDILDSATGNVTGKEASADLAGATLNVVTDSTGNGVGGGKYRVPAHSHDVDLPNFTGNSGNGNGASTPASILPPYMALNHIIKV